MALVLLILLSIALLAGGLWWATSKTKELSEYKELLNQADRELKEYQAKIERLLGDINTKNVLMERGAHALEDANLRLRQSATAISNQTIENQTLNDKIRFQESQFQKLLSQKKSSEVRVGQITEQISPFLKDFPFDPKKCRFIGDPLDFVVFGEEKVVFVEVKSGKSQLNQNQRRIRDLINEGKVEFFIYRVEGE